MTLTGCTLGLCLVIAGCSTMENLTKKDRIANVGTLATAASRRVVIVHTKVNKHEPYIESKFCAEPPPDVTENIVSSLSAKMEVSGTAQASPEVAKYEAEAKGEFYKAFQNLGQALFKRTQGAQYWRDGLFNLCQAYINGAIDNVQFMPAYNQLSIQAFELIKIEMPYLHMQTGETREIHNGKPQDNVVGVRIDNR